MNLPGRVETEAEQNYKHQLRTVRNLIDKGYSPGDIIRLAGAEELDLNRETIKKILSEEGIQRESVRQVAREIYGIGAYVTRAIFFPFTSTRLIEGGCGYPLFWTAANVLGVGAYTLISDFPEAYVSIVLGTGTANALYERYRHVKDEKVKQRLSKLEKIASGETEENSKQ